MLITFSTGKSVSEASTALEAAVAAHQFGILHLYNIRETMAKKGVEFGRECLIFEVCQPQKAEKMLALNIALSAILPCRISIYEEGGKTTLASVKPTALFGLFNHPQLPPEVLEIEEAIMAIMKEAASG
ncbi:MAG: DUF302 domain-containing protein [Chlorobium sp.]|nr:MAG: DUF302 domain-containing protein [Chlorobium sp.]